jgi:hypothetical protein
MGFCGEDKQYTDKPQWFDPLGPRNVNGVPTHTPTGGPELRDNLFKQMQDWSPAMNESGRQLAGGLQAAAGDSGWGEAADVARRTISGEYLGGAPQFNEALGNYRNQVGKAAQAVKQSALAGAADSSADLASRYARSGLGFSTANQQAAQSAKAAGTARANELAAGLEKGAADFEAGARVQNYGQERLAQRQGATQLQEAVGQPLQYLSAIPQAYMQPLAQQGQLVTGLSGGGPIATPNSTIVRQPGIYDYALSTVGSVTQGGY